MPEKASSRTPSTPAPSRRSTPAATRARAARRIQVRRSGVHGRGVFALQDIAEGETVIEYVGEVISWDEAMDRHPHDPADPNHTFYFSLEDGTVIAVSYTHLRAHET